MFVISLPMYSLASNFLNTTCKSDWLYILTLCNTIHKAMMYYSGIHVCTCAGLCMCVVISSDSGAMIWGGLIRMRS